MWWGVPHAGFVVNALASTAVAILVFHSPPGFLVGVLVHFVLREVSRIDPHFFRKWVLWQRTKARSASSLTWGGSRLLSSPTRCRSAQEIRTSV